MKLSDLKKLDIPKNPGVYRFMDSSGVLYIGKATDLRSRVRSYFGTDLIETRGPHIVDMITKSTTVKWEETESVLEALILEANEIKKNQPYYNTKEKDNKSYTYVVITKEHFPKVLLVRGRELEKHRAGVKVSILEENKIDSMFGPFPSADSLKVALGIIRKIFPFRDKRSVQKDKAEFYRQIGLTPDLSDSAVKIGYKENIEHIKKFFKGQKKTLIKDLGKIMMSHAKSEEFEKANDIKKKIFALKHINDVALIKDDFLPKKVKTSKINRIEAYDIAHLSGQNMVGVMTVIEEGSPNKEEYRKFTIKGFDKANDTGALKQVLERRFAHPEWVYPDLLVIDGGRAQKNVVHRFFKKHGLSIPVVSVVKDEKHKPKAIIGSKEIIKDFEKEILLVNHESHRFAIGFYRKKQRQIK
ncbi:MAG: excinuclease UvrABC nuclease subunit [Candidatus Paceibacteria bacterium]|jgi:excinuclease UvrABC nuclease subunit